MLRNYLKIAYRNLRRQKGYAFINVFGLAVGLACCLLIGLFVYDEFSFDRFHEKADRLYFVGQADEFGGEARQIMATQFPLARAMESDIAGVERAATMTFTGASDVRRPATGQEAEYRTMYADSTFFSMFTFPLLRGDPETALDQPNSVVISEGVARALFGDEEPVGQVVELGWYDPSEKAFTVTGVMATPPKNSYFDFEAVASLSSLREKDFSRGWGGSMYLTFAELAPGTRRTSVEEGLAALVRTHHGEESERAYPLTPITQLYLSELTEDEGFRGSTGYLAIFSSVALFVLLVALINYMNLATARAATRLREVGMRKTLGATRPQVARQFLAEAVLVASAALLLGLILAEGALPLFNRVFEKELSLLGALRPEGVLVGVGLALGVGLLAGSYPALYLSRFAPVRLLKGETGERGGAVWLRKGLVVVQFAVTVVLLVATAVVYRQLQYVQARDLGFAGEQVMAVPFESDEMAYQHATVKGEVLGRPGVLSASATSAVPGRYNVRYSVAFDPDELDQGAAFYIVSADPDYLQTLGLTLKAGRDFDPGRTSDETGAFILNEQAAAMLGRADVIGAQLYDFRPEQNEIIGVVEDYHFASLREPIGPVLIQGKEVGERPWPDYHQLLVRFEPEAVGEVLAHVRDVWARFGAEAPPDVRFLDDAFAEMYATDRRLGQVFGAFALVAVVIACLGLYGLAAFAAERRTKEIGVRKVLGASAASIVALLSKDFVKLTAVAFVVAAPVAFLTMRRWLEAFAYRVEIGPGVFLFAGALALAVALGTVGYQAIRAALANPVKSLRHE